MSNNSSKDVIYIDVDDEITSVIDKVQQSNGKIVALVLPKRASVFQSIVNMRLLKRSTQQAKKSLVLITSDDTIVPLAGVAGIHVAKTLQSKPQIPAAAAEVSPEIDTDDEITIEAPSAPSKPAVAAPSAASMSDDDTIEIDNVQPAKKPSKKPTAAAAAAKNKKLKVPNFDRFRNRLLIGAIALPVLIIGFIFANVVLPSAKVLIRTNTTSVNASVSVTASPAIRNYDESRGLVPGSVKELKKTEVQKVATTGQKDMGEKATGKVTLTTQTNCATPVQSVPSGTTVSAGTFNFIMQSGATFTPTGLQAGKCTFSSSPVDVTAEKAGDSYNLSARNYTVSGHADVSAKGTAMSGGTSNVIKVVSQQDIDGVKQKVTETVNASANQELSKQLSDEGYFAVTDTFAAKDPIVTSSPGVDAEAEEVTVTVVLTYTMTGADKDSISKLLDQEIKKNINTEQQNILDNGLKDAAIRINNKKPNGETTFDLEVTATAGVEQDEDQIRQAVAGKKKSEAEAAIHDRPGVQEVEVSYGPFWVSKVPTKESKIRVEFRAQDE